MKAIIIGAGVVGYAIAKRLSAEGQDVIIIEKNEKRIRDMQETLDVKVIQGSGSSPKVLKEADIEHADMVIAVTDSDEVNMIACLIAGTQSSIPKKIARIRNQDYTQFTDILGEGCLDIDFYINPERVAAERILRIIEVPGATDVVDFSDGIVKLVGLRIDSDCSLTGKSLKNLAELHPGNKILIAAIYRGADTIIPHGNVVLKEGDLVFVITVPQSIPQVIKLFGKADILGRKVMIVGGGNIGYYLARRLEDMAFQTKIIEQNEQRCSFLAENLEKTLVLHGDGTDEELLREEGVEDIDTFITVTNDEEDNILISLLGKNLGAQRVITLINKPEYISLISSIGVDVVVSPRLASVGGILQFVRRGNIVSVTTLMEERMEALETIALDTSDIVNIPLKDVKFAEGAIIGAIVRGEEVVIPDGNARIRPNDKVIIFAFQEAIAKVEKNLMVKLEYF
ncbi:MAG: Trk system potassium transporter TrkA [Thermodesulfobacteriota bacterium]